MIAAPLALAALLALAAGPEPDLDAIVKQLGSENITLREAATATLEKLGKTAEPALRGAADSRDPEVRARAAALLAKLDGGAKPQADARKATLVKLDFENRPLPEVIRAITEQSKIRLAPLPDPNPLWADRAITLRESEPVPFWKALDRVCEAGQIHVEPLFAGSSTTFRSSVQLREGRGQPGPTVYHGPFRIRLASIHHHHDINLDHERPEPPGLSRRKAGTSLYGILQVLAEPRMVLNPMINPFIPRFFPKVEEAVDDRGQSLVDDSEEGPRGLPISANGNFTSLCFSLRRPEQPGQMIKLIRGVAPVQVVLRKPDPMVIPLADAEGKTFNREDVAVTVRRVLLNPGPVRTIMLEFAIDRSDLPPGSPAPLPVLDQLPARLELVDAQGLDLHWFVSSSSGSRDRNHVTLSLPGNPNADLATHLRIHDLTSATEEVPFEFREIPLP